MIKPISAVALFTLSTISINTFADVEPGIFLGFDLNTSFTGTVKAEYESSDSESEADIDTSSLGFFVGYRFPTNNRFQISRTSIDASYESGTDDKFTGTDFDWQFVYGSSKFQPYWGLGFGIYTFEDSAGMTQENEDLTGISFQLLGGIKLDVHERVELDVSYRAKSIAWQGLEISDGYSSETLRLSHSSSSLNFGAIFKF